MRVFTYQSVLTSLLVLGNASAVRAEAHGDYAACKAFPGTAGWPSEESWSKFNTTLRGKLIKPGPPPGAVCHPGEPTFNSDQCAIVTAAWGTYDFHQASPVSNMWQQFNNDTCLVGPNTPCSGAGYPAYVVNATTAVDVKLSLEFARKHNVRVVVKSSGHDFQGRSQAPGALSIWVHHMQSYKTHDNAFRPVGCNFTIDTPTVTVGGGAQLGPVYEKLDKINRVIVGGNSKTVSVGGYLTAGGHSVLSPRWGLGADHVLELEVVTPMGDIVIANECQNEDLFWAMRGIMDTQNISDMQAIWTPILDQINATWPATISFVSFSPYPSFQSWFSLNYDQGAAGYNQYVGSRLLDEKAFSISSSDLGKAFMAAKSSAYLVAGKGVRNAKPRGGSISAAPTWRKAVVHSTNGHIFSPLNPAARAEAIAIVDNITEPLRQIAPDMGAYVNENNPYERDWQHTFWGENYERLLKIKREYDPHDVLWCAPCVGNERWEQIDYRLCRVDKTVS
ncbi:hypothetical protein O1611_g1684 [Lasiodiplodia mahajangana]|uniref:Uncharacterized protein n=1 Tax=Lasiodiplodia mahajangana TaxID=1108764 RepID=A0ACC2JWZ5_9PEZI|nr:hypothetical protein O1611_g1684 [Lasiodiplodia mahajangana]